MLLDVVIGGLVVGGIYALIAIGLNLQYGVARVLNLAYGEFLMLAAYAAFFGFTLIELPPPATAAIGVPAAFILSWLLFRYLLHPLLSRTPDPGKREVDSILATFGLLYLLQGVALVAWTSNYRVYSYLADPDDKLDVLGAIIQYNRLMVVVAAIVLSGTVFAFLRYSTPGRAMRAIASSPHTAPLVGIDVRKYSAAAFATGAGLAAIAGILLSSFRDVFPAMGAPYTLNALIVIVMGGIGNVAGGLVAALILGLTQALADALGQSALGTIIVFAIFSAVLLWRPQGLFGSARTAGVGGSGFRLPKEAVLVAALAALIAVPYVADIYWLLQGINILTYVALATAWAFFSGPTRYISLAASAFYGIGAYCVAVLASDYSYAVALLATVGFSVVLSALVGLATLRLSGMYFVIFTFGLASLVSAAVTWWEFNVAHSSGWYVYLSITEAQVYYQLLALCAAIVALWIWRDRTRMGFAMTTLGADETVARQIGINTVALKIGTFMVASVAMALAGAIVAPRTSYVTAQTVFNPEVSFLTVIAALLGGATSVWGPMLGVVPLLLVKDYLSTAYASHFSVILGVILLGVVFLIPNGILGLIQSGRTSLRRSAATGGPGGGKALPLSAGVADALEGLARRLRGAGHREADAPSRASSKVRSSLNGAAHGGGVPPEAPPVTAHAAAHRKALP
jgi:branched-chain amino acid transport system permease protein